jgi:uncharacterized protein YkwD
MPISSDAAITHRRFTRAAAVVLLAAAAAVPMLPAPPAAAAMTAINGVRLNTFEARLVVDINNARRSYGLSSLVVTPGTTDVARTWSWRMAGARTLSHNPALVSQLAASGSSAWTTVAENVGYGGSDNPDNLFRAYMNSPGHRANILDTSMRYLGVGTVEAEIDGVGYAWNTLDFTDAYSSAYGPTRQPAAGMQLDRVTVSTSRDVAAFESGYDQRFRPQQAGGVRATMSVDRPTSNNNALHFSVRQVSSTSGRGELVMRDALDLRYAKSVSLQVSVTDPAARAVTGELLLQTPFAASTWTVTAGTVTISPRGGWVTVNVPTSARNLRTQLVLRLSTPTIVNAGRLASVHLYDVRVNV